MFGWYLIYRNMSTDSVYFQKSIRSFKKHRSFVWIYSQLQIHTMLYVFYKNSITFKGGYAHSNMHITFNWLTLTSEIHFVKFHPEVASCLLSRGKRKYAPLGMRLLWKYIRNYFLVYQLISRFLLYLQNYKEFEAEILDLQSEKYGLSFDTKKYTTSGWALGDENVIGITP